MLQGTKESWEKIGINIKDVPKQQILNNMSTLHITIGAQGSGKSFWGKSFADQNGILYLSSDEIRGQIGKGNWDQTVNRTAFVIMSNKTKKSLKEGKDVLLDGTFAKKGWRKEFIAIGKENNSKIIAHFFTLTDKQILLERIKDRVSKGTGVDISEEVLDKYIKMIQPPTHEEGFTEIVSH